MCIWTYPKWNMHTINVINIISPLRGWFCGNKKASDAIYISKRYRTLFRKLNCADAIKGSRNIYVEHHTGEPQYARGDAKIWTCTQEVTQKVTCTSEIWSDPESTAINSIAFEFIYEHFMIKYQRPFLGQWKGLHFPDHYQFLCASHLSNSSRDIRQCYK